METKEFKIHVPDGYEIDEENSTFECIKFKKINSATYNDIAKELFYQKPAYFIDVEGIDIIAKCTGYVANGIRSKTKEQLEKLLAINRLLNVATYLNDNWVPDWSKYTTQFKYFIIYDSCEKRFKTNCTNYINQGNVYFKSEELAEMAIKILKDDLFKIFD